ncbi:MAG: hypothetical protein R3F48_00080 [Candidatus Zixiibacteriota bacterium]
MKYTQLPNAYINVKEHEISSSDTIENDLTTSMAIASRQSSTEKEARRIMQLHLLAKHPFLIQNEIFNLADISSGSKKSKLKKYLINRGWYKEHTLQHSRKKIIILEPLPKAYRECDVQKSKSFSKGGYLHEFCRQRVIEYFEELGFKAKNEYFLSNNKAVDILLTKEDETVFIEIGISSSKQELGNAIKNLSTSLIPTRLLMLCKDSKMKKKLESLIKAEEILEEFKKIISVELVGNYIKLYKSRG